MFAGVQGFRLLSVLIAPVLPQLAARVARELSDLIGRSCGATPMCSCANQPIQHLMTRVDPKQLDALFESDKEAAPTATTTARRTSAPPERPMPPRCGGHGLEAIDIDRRVPARRPAGCQGC